MPNNFNTVHLKTIINLIIYLIKCISCFYFEMYFNYFCLREVWLKQENIFFDKNNIVRIVRYL